MSTGGGIVERFVVDDQERWAIFHRPSSNEEAATEKDASSSISAAVLVFHGSSRFNDFEEDEDPTLFAVQRFEQNYDSRYFGPHRDSNGYLMVYVAARRMEEGGYYCWENNGREFGSCQYTPQDGNDAAFCESIIARIRNETETTEPEIPIYAFGFSGGAKFVWKYRNLFDAVGPIAGGLSPSLMVRPSSGGDDDDNDGNAYDYCNTPVVTFNGDQDTINPIEENRDSVLWYKDICGCKSTRISEIVVPNEIDDDSSDSMNVTLIQYTDCEMHSNSSEFYIHFYTVHGAGHTIPGAPYVWSGLGPTSSIDSLEQLWYTWTTGGDVKLPPESSSSCHHLPTMLSVAVVLVLFWLR